MNNLELKNKLGDEIIDKLKEVYDPEISVNIYDLGMIYEIKISDDFKAHIVMTLTSPNCPVAESLPAEVNQKAREVDGLSDVEVELTFEPPWDQSMLSETAKLELGFL
ncbi:MAG: DUF59 domain-containing protein [Bacteroidales bacterium]|nr:DUF59 domain-containing protein [Bacteroidales bacterium]